VLHDVCHMFCTVHAYLQKRAIHCLLFRALTGPFARVAGVCWREICPVTSHDASFARLQAFPLFAPNESDRRKDPLGVVFLSHWGAEEEV
jgi:hypothetical protein